MICPTCCREAFAIVPSTWVVCIATGNKPGETIHESWSFGPGSPMSDAQAETTARAWAATERRHRYPIGQVLAVWRNGAAK